jgi:hypothetical protein
MSVIVVDNDSGDGSAEMIQSKFSDRITLIRCDENNGYAGGMNAGLIKAKDIGAEYALLLNADITLASSTIEAFMSAAEECTGGDFFGPRIYDVGKPEDRWFVGGRWDWGQGTIRIVRESTSDSLPNTPRQIEFVNGAAMFIRLSAIEITGLFDERFGLYFEESDLCSRAAKAGCTLWHVPRAVVWHACGASTTKSDQAVGLDAGQYYRTRNRLLWGTKNLSGFRSLVFWLNVLARFPTKWLTAVMLGRRAESHGIALGARDFFNGKLGMLR